MSGDCQVVHLSQVDSTGTSLTRFEIGNGFFGVCVAKFRGRMKVEFQAAAGALATIIENGRGGKGCVVLRDLRRSRRVKAHLHVLGFLCRRRIGFYKFG